MIFFFNFSMRKFFWIGDPNFYFGSWIADPIFIFGSWIVDRRSNFHGSRIVDRRSKKFGSSHLWGQTMVFTFFEPCFWKKYLTATISTEMSLITSDCFNVFRSNWYIINQCIQTSMDRLETLFFTDKKVWENFFSKKMS